MTTIEVPATITTSGVGAECSSDINISLRRRLTAADSNGALVELALKSGELESDGGGHAVMDPELEKNKANDSENRSDFRFTYRPSVPAHRVLKESPLSSDASLFNLCIVVLVAVNSRLIIENLMKYGLLIKTGFWFSSRSLRDWPLLMCCLTLPIFPLAAYLVEKLAYRKYISDPIVIFLHFLITSAAVLYPVSLILSGESAVLSGVTLMLFACIVWLKLVSFAHTNFDMRVIANSVDKGDAVPNTLNADYTHDVSFKSLVYFMVAPTLCYQGWVVRQFIKFIIFTGFMGFIKEQYINSIVKNSQHPLKGDLLYAIERVLKLSVPNLYVWLCMFYCFFHLWLNILAELPRFGDREFYKDWWNARTVNEYWRTWNMPVHKWMVRHIYFPCLQHKIPKGIALVIAFFISAVFHEPVDGISYVNFLFHYCIRISVLKTRLDCCVLLFLVTYSSFGAFIGIMFQVPLVVITNYLQNKLRSSMVGNMIFWFIFCILGQPMSVLLYYHDLMNRKGNTE